MISWELIKSNLQFRLNAQCNRRLTSSEKCVETAYGLCTGLRDIVNVYGNPQTMVNLYTRSILWMCVDMGGGSHLRERGVHRGAHEKGGSQGVHEKGGSRKGGFTGGSQKGGFPWTLWTPLATGLLTELKVAQFSLMAQNGGLWRKLMRKGSNQQNCSSSQLVLNSEQTKVSLLRLTPPDSF